MKRLFKISLYAIIIFAAVMLAGHITFKLLSFSRKVAVPELKGKSMVEADNIARSKGLYIRLEGEDYDSNVPQGYIIRQDIPPGNEVKEGREIKIVLSKGPKVRYVPDVVGQPFEAAEAMLKEKGIKIERVVYVHDDKTDKNIVLAQRPEPNEKGGDSFSLLVSLGGHDNK